ncbi:hypothetical protein [Sporocytophaga myxococcoides]|uniref:hypothetical protein n=1 Tax=Sporocytophaga myxococcoides TaxID=153721 RepID=UPI0012DF9E36|nr:hypothetical protein [Sporocytophaga myxococcoides]
MSRISILLLLSIMIYSCSGEKNTEQQEVNTDSSAVIEKAAEQTVDTSTSTVTQPSSEVGSFPSFLSKFKDLTTPVELVARDLEEDELTAIDTNYQSKFIKPFTTKISEKDYPYNFNYPDFKTDNYKAIGKVTLSENVTLAIFSLFYESYTFIGVIAYDKDGKILDGKMAAEEEGGSAVRMILKGSLDKSENTVVLKTDYVEEHYDAKGKLTEKNPKKTTYKFDLSIGKFVAEK